MEALDVISIAWILFNYVVLCPILVFSLYKFNKMDRDEKMMKYRSKKLVLIINIVMLFILLFNRLYTNSVSMLKFLDIRNKWIFYLNFSLLFWSVFILFAIKVFHLYYKQRYSSAFQDMVWKKEINPNTYNWFISNKNKFGRPKYCIKIIIIPFIICVAINTFVAYAKIDALILHCIQYSIPLICILFSLLVFYKSKDIKDIYFIRNEIFYQIILLMVALLLYICTLISFRIILPNPNQNVIRIEWLCRNLCADLLVVGLALISTIYPLYIHNSKYDLISNNGLKQHKKIGRTYNSTDAIQQILANYDSYRIFMQYLVSEFCPEALFFITELIMIKYEYQETHVKDIDMSYMIQKYKMPADVDVDNDGIYSYIFDGIGSYGLKLKIAANIPRPVIICDANNIQKQMLYLYDKYVKYYSEYELNLSSSAKTCLCRIFENEKDFNELTDVESFNIFDNAAIEIINLLKDPFHRFLNNPLFEKRFADLKKMKSPSRSSVMLTQMRKLSTLITINDEEKEKEQDKEEKLETPFIFQNKKNENLNSNIYKLVVANSIAKKK
eukprot:4798_1